MNTEMKKAAEREKFESWAIATHPSAPLTKWPDGSYDGVLASRTWGAWKARAELAARPLEVATTAWIDGKALEVARRFTLDTEPQRRASLQVAVIEAMKTVRALEVVAPVGDARLEELAHNVVHATFSDTASQSFKSRLWCNVLRALEIAASRVPVASVAVGIGCPFCKSTGVSLIENSPHRRWLACGNCKAQSPIGSEHSWGNITPATVPGGDGAAFEEQATATDEELATAAGTWAIRELGREHVVRICRQAVNYVQSRNLPKATTR